MSLVIGRNITFKYKNQTEEILKAINFEVSKKAKIALTGDNGSGKSTFKKILTGEILDFQGHLDLTGRPNVVYLDQSIRNTRQSAEDYVWQIHPDLYFARQSIRFSKDWAAFDTFERLDGYGFQNRIQQLCVKLSLAEKDLLKPISQLSGGQKTKLGLLRLLLCCPDLLILDEPSNYLDKPSKNWLKMYLSRLEMAFILISHDRSLLDGCTQVTWELDKGHLETYSGNYSRYKKHLDEKKQSDIQKHWIQKKKIAKLQSAANLRRVNANKMENFKKTRSVKKNGGICKRDDGSGRGGADPNFKTKMMKSAKAVEHRIEMTLNKEMAKLPFVEKSRKIHFDSYAKCQSAQAVVIENICFSYDLQPIFKNFSLSLKKGIKHSICGPNGSGKSTLIKLLAGVQQPSSGSIKWSPSAKVCVYHQDSNDLNPANTVISEIWNPEIHTQSKVRQALGGFHFKPEMAQKLIGELSHGERSKVRLAKCLLSGANVLVLDEPTNHLDIRSIEILEEALKDFEGTLILVSHDQKLVDQIAENTVEISAF